MKSKISLTIVLTGSISFGIALAEDAKASNTQTQNIEDSEESSLQSLKVKVNVLVVSVDRLKNYGL